MNILKTTTEKLLNYIERSENNKTHVTKMRPLSDMRELFQLKKAKDENDLSQLIDQYLEYSTHIHSPRYIGHQVAKPHPASSAADFIHGVINNSAAVYDMGQAGNVIEQNVIEWMCSKLGWDHNSFGVLTAGGSAANLTAMLTARAAACEDVWQQGNDSNLVALVPDISHYCVARTMSIMGLGAKNILTMPTDDKGKVIISKVGEIIDEAKSKGLKPFVIVANACSTSVGSHDDLKLMGEIAQKYNIWFHVDGAHGASAVLSEKYKSLLDGIELADSVVWDTHKMMGTSSLCGAALFKDRNSMSKTFHQDASYLNDGKAMNSFAFFPFTLECTKPAYGLKVYLMYAMIGETGFSDHVEKLYDKTKKFQEYIKTQDDFEAPIEAESNIIVFKYLKSSKQKEIYDRILGSGNFHMTFTEFKKQPWLRLTVMNPLTELEHIKQLLDEIRSISDI